MIDTGDYQNEISDLTKLPLGSYERIFKIFKSSLEDKEFYVFNTLKKIEFPTIDDEFLGLESIRFPTPMSIVSYNIYGDLNSWWILYLLNKDAFSGAPFRVEAGTQLKYILPEVRTAIYSDITQATIYEGRHY